MTAPTLTEVTTAQRLVQRREAALQQALAARAATMLAAQRAGATYPDLARATGLTRDRVNQVLAAERARTSTTAS